MIDLTALALQGSQILADSDSEGGFSISWLFFLSGFIFYAIIFLRYRNTNKRHKHAVETEADLADMKAGDQLSRSLRGVSHSSMQGANNKKINGAQRKGLGLGF